MQVDVLFYQLFQSFPAIFFDLLGQPDVNVSNYEFTSPEVKQPTFRFDGVLKPKSNSPDDILYFIEVQFQKRAKFYTRLFAEINLYFNQYDPPYEDWYAVVIFKNRNTEVMAPLRYQEVMERRVIQIYLDEIESLAQRSIGVGLVQLLAVTSKRKLGERAQELIERASQTPSAGGALSREQAIELVQTIVLYRFPNLSREELEAMLGLADLKNTKVYQELQQEVRAEALQEGELKAKVELVSRMLSRDFGVQEIVEILDLRTDTVVDAAIAALLKAKLNAKQIAKRLELEVSQVTPKAVRLLLSEGKSEAQVVQQIGITLAAVRRVTQPKLQKAEEN
ncbi:MAG: Rpn family recombination-promoting nuclease/putative transposase [Drouetiella hepatica Uher 2000/2452]|uniref:Rpn family recombination-promoting nuclease/putative transposase n=1 Tax=Drouetiella hepatica Uher 2000/2452 TaxID=904376 RepID=A0A951UQ16_9CYAN|nr:Rpn family recombination-promoting nuclease/putative transposase [Drouetiella hepatica Uher 2000/2452]